MKVVGGVVAALVVLLVVSSCTDDVAVVGASGRAELGADANPGPRHYVALGDSFSSGEGAPVVTDAELAEFDEAYPGLKESSDPDQYLSAAALRYGWLGNTGTDLGGHGNGCHRSEHAYPVRVFNALEESDSDWGISFRACSGARTDAMDQLYNGEPRQLDAFVPGSPADLVTLGFGGNDLGFADIVMSCTGESIARAFPSLYGRILPACREIWEPRVVQQLPEVREAVRKVLWDAVAPGRLAKEGKAMIVLYPRPFPDSPSGSCSLGSGGSISVDNMRWVNTGVTDRLNAVIQDEARHAGVSVIDTSRYLTSDFGRHDLCVDDGAQRWINRVIPSDYKQSIHPKFGYHERVADAVISCMQSCPTTGPVAVPTAWMTTVGCQALSTLPYRRFESSTSQLQFLLDVEKVESVLAAGARKRADAVEQAGPPVIPGGSDFAIGLVSYFRDLEASANAGADTARSMQQVARTGRPLSLEQSQAVKRATSHDFAGVQKLIAQYPGMKLAFSEAKC